MSGGQIAGLIAALAFVALVVVISIFLVRLTKSLGIITNDVDQISHEVEEVLANANVLLTDVDEKVKTVDPAFQAVADLGLSVSELNGAAKNLTNHVGKTTRNVRGFSRLGLVTTLGKPAWNSFKRYRANKKNKTK